MLIHRTDKTDGLLISAAEQLLHLIVDRADVLLELLGGLHQLNRHHRPHLQVQHSSDQQEQAGVQSSSVAALKMPTWCFSPGQASLSDLLLQLLLKLFDSTDCSSLLGSDLLLHIRAFFLDETDKLSENLPTVLHCFVSRLIDGLHLLLEQIHIFLAEITGHIFKSSIAVVSRSRLESSLLQLLH
ncbi:unnamed protein product [Menidia menidia]|uniref:(Atlantic silverside) hypothetical protein n=1 Tax=Menidia menidia TaxID=238744 RepID=A0A8S4BXJ1_9TELE|nr:unnamed protein product [Menidia menidia]